MIPQVPDGQPGVEGSDVRVGRGSIDVAASRAGKAYTTKVNATKTPGDALTLGVTLPVGSRPRRTCDWTVARCGTTSRSPRTREWR